MQFSILFFASAVLAAPLALSTAPTFNYHDNVDNLATSKTYVDAEGITHAKLVSPYTDDVKKANAAAVLGQ